jgi:hypothetical protein
MLKPGETRRTDLEIRILDGPDAIAGAEKAIGATR